MLSLSCNKDDNNQDFIEEENGQVWRSGGLWHCAEQIHLDSGDTLIVNIEDISSLTSGDKVNVKYNEMGINENCPFGIDCEITEIKKID